MGSPTRSYRGRSATERTAERRERLLAAALELWGDGGWASVTMRGVCARAGLNDRYFYESFADVEALLLAVYDRALDDLVRHLRRTALAEPEPRARLRASVSAFVTAFASDPRRARVGLAEPAGSPALERRRRATYAMFAELARGELRPADPAGFEAAMYFALGGAAELVIRWVEGTLPMTAANLEERVATLVLTVVERHL
ncbi:TetR/AcrR family transcriptional regulator [Actinocorallia sp. A-T 12471]|uniref:TetR/AcrR family transcriptional regulator n=1 Tax=Actinocorallia sp. A-T 12471 TaxID=3089813 RepID=UPI0029CB8C90|nr:TetR/AcrR family transcriptional regulator [Actinocorallia sp. A-T 12471]MDX6743555.1 TetR/AcrR family transcriptional regulator [Actinocorallia sp. A-T 12471]